MFRKLLAAAALALPMAAASIADQQITCQAYSANAVPVTTTPPLVSPQGVAVDGNGNVFVVDSKRRDLIRIDSGSGHNSSILLGQATLQVPVGLAISPVHADLYIGDENTSTIYHLPCQTRNQNYCSLYYGNALTLSLATAVHPLGLRVDAMDHLFIADFNGHHVWRRDVNSLNMTSLMDDTMLQKLGYTLANPFGPSDLAIDPQTHTLHVTDANNDDIWSLACSVPDTTGQACSVYSQIPVKLSLTGSDIDQPGGIALDYLGTKYVTGTANGIVAEITGNNSVDLLSPAKGSTLMEPVAVAIDKRAMYKTLYISDDPSLAVSGDTSNGLWSLPCKTLVCVPLDTSIVANVVAQTCKNTAIGSTCNLACKNGFTASSATISCTTNGWATATAKCSSPSAGTTTAAATTAEPNGDAGVAVGVTLTLIILAGVGAFLFVRYRQGKLIVKKAADHYTTTFGQPDNV